MSRTQRVLLVEHVDATGAAPADVHTRTLALREAGFTVEALVLDDRPADDLQFETRERRPGPGFDVLPGGEAGRRALAARVRASRADRVLWASAAPGGGDAARTLPEGLDAWWWPTGHSPGAAGAGPLAALPGFAPPGGASAAEPLAIGRNRLSLWDGPFVLVPAPPSDETVGLLLDAFAQAASGRDEVDLVVLDHPHPRLESLVRERGIGLRAHFVGPAPREAECAWIATAALSLLTGDAPLSGGLVLRALALGSAPVACGTAAAPVADWLSALGCSWATPTNADELATAIERALDRETEVQRAREAGREAARRLDTAALAARLAGRLAAKAAA